MAKKSRKLNKFFNVLVILFLVGAVGFFAFFTRGFKTDLKSFCIVYKNELITGDQDNLCLENSNRFDVRYLQLKNKSYNVKILNNTNCNFEFTVDGEKYNFNQIIDYTKYFDLFVYDDNFVLNLPNDLTILNLLKKVYLNKHVVISENLDFTNDYFYIQVVVGKSVIKLGFNVYIGVASVSLDKEKIDI